jgi:hypothetical protein
MTSKSSQDGVIEEKEAGLENITRLNNQNNFSSEEVGKNCGSA